MLELAEHILDIAENSIRAGAGIVEIIINEDSAKDLLTIEINDNGSGMTKEEILIDFPELTLEDIHACLKFASDREMTQIIPV